MPNIDSQLNKDSWGWELRLKFKKLCTSWPSKQPSDIKLNFEPCRTPQAKVLCMWWVNHCAQVRWWTTTSSPPPSSWRWAKEKHHKNCESCPTQMSCKLKQVGGCRISYILQLACLSKLEVRKQMRALLRRSPWMDQTVSYSVSHLCR